MLNISNQMIQTFQELTFVTFPIQLCVFFLRIHLIGYKTTAILYFFFTAKTAEEQNEKKKIPDYF